MPTLLVHLSDAHLKSGTDALILRARALARAIVAEMDSAVKACVVIFTGDATDKGNRGGFPVAKQFLEGLIAEIRNTANIQPEFLLVPGNHDVVLPEDSSLRDLAVASLLEGGAATTRPKPAVENAVLAPLDDYFAFANALAPNGSPTKAAPYYVATLRVLEDKRVLFHLLNSSWMCNRGQGPGSLLFPVDEIQPPRLPTPPDYEITLLHHPFNWFKQPEALRPLRNAVEAISDMILTGHEHVGRSTTTAVHGVATYEYREGEPLQDGPGDEISGFHLIRLDFANERQSITTYRWERNGGPGAYVRVVGPAESPLGRNVRRASQHYRLRPAFEAMLEDPGLPVLHAQRGKLRLSDFYTYPDLGQIQDSVRQRPRRVRGELVLDFIVERQRVLLIGPDRCGKSSLAKRLVADLHARGLMPLLVDGAKLKNVTIDRLQRVLEGMVAEQYDAVTPEAYWQVPPEQRIMILDDLHHGPQDKKRREQLVSEIGRRFDRVVIIGTDEFCFEELFADIEEQRASNPLWGYQHYRILPFGYMRCDEFVHRWVGLDTKQELEAAEKRIAQINGLLTQFLRNNPIPQYPWVVMIIVQQADSPEPPHAENGSYGFLLQALITAALAKSRIGLPINGKYRWLSELAHHLYTHDQSVLPDELARQIHDRYRREYGVSDLDYKEIRDDLAAAGVLRVDGTDVSFRQPYTYCYFVAYHLAHRIHAGDVQAQEEVRRLCEDLYHEDTASVLVFLAHLTTSRVVLEQMTKRAAELFADAAETDFANDIAPLNMLYDKVQALVLPHGDPQQNRRRLQDHQDEIRAERTCSEKPNREITLHPNHKKDDKEHAPIKRLMEIVTAMRTIEILGQVLRNEATARKLPAMVEITDQVFRLGRRLLGFLFTRAGERLELMVKNLEEHYRTRMPEAKDDTLANEVSRYMFNMYAFAAFAVVKHVATAVGERNLGEVFRQLVEKDGSLANRIYKLAIDLEINAGKPPLRDAEMLNDELAGKVKSGDKRTFNNLAHTLVRALVVDYLHLNYVPHAQAQALCQKLDIEVPAKTMNPSTKRLPPSSQR